MSEFDEDDGKWKLEKERTGDVAIRLSNVSITYRTSFERAPTLKSALLKGGGKRRIKVVDAVKDVSFEIPHGTILGILGHNGAGKSTLMRAVSGIMPPSEGTIEVYGEVSALLSLGAGFNSSLSGRENILLSGLASGMTRKQVEEKLPEIIEFAEIDEFIDMPVSTYSSGMSQRLAFSVAVHMDPDILLIDEALSAGDARFKVKAQAKMQELMKTARTMLVVSHAVNTIRELCNDAIWLDHGKLMMHDEPEKVIDAYLKFMKVGKDSAAMEDF